MRSLIFYLSYLSIPFLILLIFFTYKNRKWVYKDKALLLGVILFFLITFLFIYARFIERNIIVTQITKIHVGFSAKFIVASDFHLGVYKDVNFLKRVVDKINDIKNADAVLIPGDFIYHPSGDLDVLFSPLRNIKYPVYAVLGNHDMNGFDVVVQEKLQKALANNGVIFLSNSGSHMKNKNITILGLWDNWFNQDDISKIHTFTKADNLIVMTHNPDTVSEYKNTIPDITISGHTHGGQIRLPYIYKYIIPCVGDFDQGIYNVNENKVFVTSGMGETGLPMRLWIPPTIDILELY